MNIINNEKRNYIMKNEKMNNDEIPCSMQMPKSDGESEARKHIRKEIDDWLKEGNKKTIIPTDKGTE